MQEVLPSLVRSINSIGASDVVDVAIVAVLLYSVLRLLRTAGVVRARRDGRTVWYRLDDEHVRLLLDQSRTHLSHRS